MAFKPLRDLGPPTLRRVFCMKESPRTLLGGDPSEGRFFFWGGGGGLGGKGSWVKVRALGFRCLRFRV